MIVLKTPMHCLKFSILAAVLPVSLWLQLANAQQTLSSRPVIVAGHQFKLSFISGGNYLEVTTDSLGNFSKSFTLQIYYFGAENQSPEIADRVFVSQPCQNLSKSVMRCSYPDLSALYENYTADTESNSKVTVDPLGYFGGCRPVNGMTRLCYSLNVGNERLGYHGESSYGNPFIDGMIRRTYVLTYYPNPVVFNVSMETETLMAISGIGFKPRLLNNYYNVSLMKGRLECLLRKASRHGPNSILPKSNSSSRENNDTTLYCDINRSLMYKVFDDEFGRNLETFSALNLDVAIQNGNWKESLEVTYPLKASSTSPTDPDDRPGPMFTGEPEIMHVRKTKSFRSGGNSLVVLFFSISGGKPKGPVKLVISYYQPDNQSPDKADESFPQACQAEGDFLFSCPFPNLSKLFPNYTSDNTNATMHIVPHYKHFRTCRPEPGKRRLCYSILDNDKTVGTISNINNFEEESQHIMQIPMTLFYFPDPVISNVTLISENRLKITGRGLFRDKVYEQFKVSIYGLHCAMPKINDPESLKVSDAESLNCTFDNARLMDKLEQFHGADYLQSLRSIPVEVTVENGNWMYRNSMVYQLANAPPPPPSTLDHDDDGPSVEIIIAIVVPVCFIAIVIACACVGLCSMKYGYSPTMIKIVEHVFPNIPDWIQPPKNNSQHDTSDLEQVMKLLPGDMAAVVKDNLIDPTRIHSGPVLGKGFFGIVCSGKLMNEKEAKRRSSSLSAFSRKPGEMVAMKCVQNYSDVDSIKECFQEAVYMLSFNHPNVLGAKGVSSVSGSPAVILPLMDAGDLRSFVLSAANQITDPLLIDFARQIAKGMQYLSENKIIHRDLAARNCLLNKERVVKVADFGLSRKAEDVNETYEFPEYQIKTHGKPLPIRWMAPESLETGAFSEKSDVWAYGIVLWELATRGARPYAAVESKDVKRYVCVEKQRLPKLPVVSNCLYTLMTPCWNEHSSARSSFSELVILTENLLNDPTSELWTDSQYKYEYHNPQQLDPFLNEDFENSLLAMSGEYQPEVKQTDTTVTPSMRYVRSINTHPITSDNCDIDDETYHGAGGPTASTDSGMTGSSSPPLIKHSASSNEPDRNSNSSTSSRRHSPSTGSTPHSDRDSVFIGSTPSRPGTPTPPDSAISGMSFISTPRESWHNRSFKMVTPHPVQSSPSLDSAASFASFSSSNGHLASTVQLTRLKRVDSDKKLKLKTNNTNIEMLNNSTVQSGTTNNEICITVENH